MEDTGAARDGGEDGVIVKEVDLEETKARVGSIQRSKMLSFFLVLCNAHPKQIKRHNF